MSAFPWLLSLQAWLLDLAVESSILILAILLIQRLAGRWLTPRWHYLLWGLVVLRLLAPTLPQAPFGLQRPDWSLTGTHSLPGSVAMETVGNIPPMVRVERKLPVQTALAQAVPEQPAAPADAAPAPIPTDAAVHADGAPLPSSSFLAAEQEPTAGSATLALPWWAMSLLLIWFIGAITSLGRLLLRERRFRRRLEADAQPLQDHRLHRLSQEACRRWGLDQAPPLCETTLLDSPALCGLRQPQLLLPAATWRTLDDSQLLHVLLHELAHLRHRDVLLNWLLAGLRALHWYHPLLRLAFAHLRESQELLRDYQVLHRLPAPAPRAYAATLLQLASSCEGRPQPATAAGLLHSTSAIRRRIHMIITFRSPTRFASAFGLSLFLGLGTLGMTRGGAILAVTQPDTSQEAWRTIEVVREQPEAAWKTAMKASLARPLDLTLENASVEQVAEILRKLLDINVIIGHDLLNSGTDAWVEAKQTSALTVLDRISSQGGYSYMLYRNALVLDWTENLQAANDQRFYDIRPLTNQMEQMDEDGDSFDHIDRLMDLINLNVDQEAWDNGIATIQEWRGLLVVNASDRTHAKLKQFLEFLLNRGREAQQATTAEDSRQFLLLAQLVDIKFHGETLGEITETLRETYGLSIYVDEEEQEEGEIDLELKQVPLADVVAWCSELSGVPVAQEGGYLHYTYYPPMQLRAFEIGDLVNDLEDVGDGIDSLIDLLQNGLGEGVWDRDNARMESWNGLLLVNQTEDVLDRVDAFLRAARKMK